MAQAQALPLPRKTSPSLSIWQLCSSCSSISAGFCPMKSFPGGGGVKAGTPWGFVYPHKASTCSLWVPGHPYPRVPAAVSLVGDVSSLKIEAE